MADFRGATADDFNFTALAPEDAVDFFTRKGFAIAFDWHDVWQEEHARAFTVAKAMTVDLLDDIRSVVDKAIAEGIAFEDFQAKLEPILRARGWWGRQEMADPLTGAKRDVQLGSVRRLGIIYDTNLRTSYSAGRWAQIQRVKERRPWLRYNDPDPNPRLEHLDWSGTIVHADDPWVATHFTPNGWHCKCYFDNLSSDDLERYGYKITGAPPDEMVPYTNPRTGQVTMTPRGVDPGFAHNVGDAGLAEARRQLDEKLNSADPLVAAAIKKRWPQN